VSSRRVSPVEHVDAWGTLLREVPISCHDIKKVVKAIREKIEGKTGSIDSDYPFSSKDATNKDQDRGSDGKGNKCVSFGKFINLCNDALAEISGEKLLPNKVMDRGHGADILGHLDGIRDDDMIQGLKRIFAKYGSERDEGMSAEIIVASFVSAARIAMMRILLNEITIDHVRLQHGNVDSVENQKWLLRNVAQNYLRLIGIMPEVPYDELWEREIYRFMVARNDEDLKNRSALVSELLDNDEKGKLSLDGKTILDIGAGAGRDAIHLLMANGNIERIVALDKSVEALKVMKARLTATDPGLSRKIRVIEVGMKKRIKNMVDRKEKGEDYYHADMPKMPDVVIANSVMHRMDLKGFHDIALDILKLLSEDGVFAFGCKNTGGRFYRSGIIVSSTGSKRRANYGLDGQIRFQRQFDTYDDILVDRKSMSVIEEHNGVYKLYVFRPIDQKMASQDSYEIEGDIQKWIIFILKKVCVAESDDYNEIVRRQKILPGRITRDIPIQQPSSPESK
jgi:SAM-dependent methyltransferase